MICLAGYDLCKSYTDSNQTINVLRKATLEVQESNWSVLQENPARGKQKYSPPSFGFTGFPDSGKVMIGGKLCAVHYAGSLASIRNLELGFVFQFYYLIEDLTEIRKM